MTERQRLALQIGQMIDSEAQHLMELERLAKYPHLKNSEIAGLVIAIKAQRESLKALKRVKLSLETGLF